MTTFDIEKEQSPEGGRFVVGVDEVGRGPLAGPVVAAAVAYRDMHFVIPPECESALALIRDSKKLSEKQREELFLTIPDFFAVGMGIISPETIDRVNILEATFLAMKAAITDLTTQRCSERR
jgi:ribonuclease HII